MKIYIAHNYGARIVLRDVIPQLEAMGHQITSRWVTDDAHDTINGANARADLDDIDRADAVLLFVDQWGDRPGKGKYVELGYAIGIRKRVILIGKDDGCIFYHLTDCGMGRVQDIEQLRRL